MSMTRTAGSRLISIGALLVVASLVTACGGPLTAVTGPREWTATVERADGTKVDVVVRDSSGRITEVALDPPGVIDPGAIANPGGDLAVVLVPWAGGSCDARTEISFVAKGQGLAGTINSTATGEVCDMMAIPHLVRLTVNAPTPAAMVTLEPGPTP